MAAKVQIRRGTAAQWSAANPVLSDGELGVESDTSKIKVGNGSAPWNSLPYVAGLSLAAGAITSTELASSSVVEAKIANGAVTSAKIASNTITASNIQDLTITKGKIANTTIDETKIADGAITQAKMANTISAVTICTSSTRPASPFTGQAIFETDTNKMKLYNGSSWIGVSTVKKVASFTASGTWTVPAGVTYAVAHIRAGGGGAGTGSSGAGGTSSVAFASGTVSATGGNGANGGYTEAPVGVAGVANSGQGARFNGSDGSNTTKQKSIASDGAYIVAGGVVTPAASISVTVGAGGTAGTSGAAGGSGYVWIEYEE